MFCISAGQLIVKKANNKINKRNRYLNYGLLSLASTLKNEGWNTVQIQGHFDDPSVTLRKCISLGYSESTTLPLLISIPSFYAISWVNEFIYLAKEINSKVKIILGGRWVIADRKDLMEELVPDADIIVSGVANSIICKLIGSIIEKPSKNVITKLPHVSQYPFLDYSLLIDRTLYQPSIEVSRGCGMGCSFCQEKDEKLLEIKTPEIVIDEIKSTIIHDDLNTMNMYFEASMFIPGGKWVAELLAHRDKSGLNFYWRAESRVDTINIRDVEKLAKTGLKILDLGLESASPLQLIRMNKTKNPEKYLARASALIKECYAYDISIKINVLLSAGETESTIAETIKWLEQHKEYIRGVSVGPVTVYGWLSDTKNTVKNWLDTGRLKVTVLQLV